MLLERYMPNHVMLNRVLPHIIIDRSSFEFRYHHVIIAVGASVHRLG